MAGALTALAPCVLPLLPVIIGGSVSGNVKDTKRPFIIAASLAVSLILFTVLLKVTTLFIAVPPSIFVYISGGILVLLGIVFLFPNLYESLLLRFNLQAKSQQLLGKAGDKKGVAGLIITGAALGPVFSSCSPVYAYILATILPVNLGLAMVAIVAYVLGLSAMLLLIGFLGQKLVRKMRFAIDPRGWFNRVVAILFIIVGLLVLTGYDKKFQTYISEHTPFDFDSISAQLIPNATKTSGGILNVEPYAAPEFSFEKNPANVEEAVKKAGLTYPIALDNDFATWNAYKNQYWPASYLIDREGNVRRYHGGEGEYKETEMAIRQLLSEGGSVPSETTGALDGAVPVSANQTPETYLGTRRASNFVGTPRLAQGSYEFSQGELKNVNYWTLGGAWTVDGESITAGDGATLRFRFAAKDLYVVTADDAGGKEISVSLNGKPISATGAAGDDVKDSRVRIDGPELYRLVHFEEYQKDATLELTVPFGVKFNVFTFGS